MNILWIALQEHAAETVDEGVNVFSFVSGVSFWTVVIFLGLLAVLVKFAFPPILGYAEAREKRIQAGLDDAKRQRAEAESLLEQQRKELSTARQEAQQLIAEAKQLGERARQDVLVRARSEQEEIVTRAKDEIEREREKALESIRREAVELAMAAASKLLEKRLSADEDRRLVTEYLSRAEAHGPAGVA
jgi:F-type H+-transporting ATPase subunit b